MTAKARGTMQTSDYLGQSQVMFVVQHNREVSSCIFKRIIVWTVNYIMVILVTDILTTQVPCFQ